LPPTFACAWLSWNLVEHPILGRKTSILAALDRRVEAIDATIGSFARRRAPDGLNPSAPVTPGE
jgi:peptidoglycan/LPS O-acetylase OafA/YrhL